MEITRIDLPENGILLYESKHGDGHEVAEHRHAIHQILYVLDGNGYITMEGKRSELTPDNFVLIVPRSDHSIVSVRRLTLLVLAFEEAALGEEVQRGLLMKQLRQSMVLYINPMMATDIRQLLRKMMFEQGNHDALCSWALRIYLQEVLLLLSRSQQQGAKADSNLYRAERIRKYIDDNYFKPITNGDLSSKMNMSARHVNGIFKECYGITPFQYMTEVRIRAAQKLLSETDKDIVTICFEVGYENVPTFYRSFRNVVKLPPNKFRQQHKE
jgi:AraC-like DNA-binding protein